MEACVEGREEPGMKLFAIECRDLKVIFILEDSDFISKCNLMEGKNVPWDEQSIWENVFPTSVILWCEH